MKILVVLALSSIGLNIYSQDGVDLIFKINPFAIINPYRPSIQGGAELLLAKRIGFEYLYGYKYDHGDQPDTIFLEPFGNASRFEVRLYTLKNKYEITQFVGLAHWHMYCQNNSQNENPVSTSYGENYAYKTTTLAFALNYGIIYHCKRVWLEANAGVGIRYKNRELIDIPTQNKYLNTIWNSGGDGGLLPYRGFYPHINIGVKAGFVIF